MIINSWLVLETDGDRPYVSTVPPLHLVRKPGTKVFRVEIAVPEPVPVDGVISAQAVPTEIPC